MLDPSYPEGHNNMGIVLRELGRPQEAVASFDRAIALYDPAEHRPLATRFGQDVGAATLCWKSLTFWRSAIRSSHSQKLSRRSRLGARSAILRL